MAIRYAVATGNWSDVSTWDGGTTLPTVGDDVYANGFTVTVDQDIEVAKISTEVCPTTSISGGRFSLPSADRNLICDIFAGSSTCLYASSFNNKIINIIGNIYGSDTTADCKGFEILTGNPSYVYITGNVQAGNKINSFGYIFSQTYGNNYIQVTGNVYASNAAAGIGTTANSKFMYITIYGNVIPSASQSAIYLFKSLHIYGYITGDGTTSQFGAISGDNAAVVIISGICDMTNGVLPVRLYNWAYSIPIIFESPITLNVVTVYDTFSLYTSDAFDQPAEADVREGTSYASSTLTGTLAVPDPSNVVAGVPTDDTVGTWVFNPEVIQRLLNCSTVAITGQQIASYNGAPAELVPTYEKRYDAVYGTPDILYLGAAPVGTLDASTIWNLTKIILATDGSIASETHATDSWDNHLTATYV